MGIDRNDCPVSISRQCGMKNSQFSFSFACYEHHSVLYDHTAKEFVCQLLNHQIVHLLSPNYLLKHTLSE